MDHRYGRHGPGAWLRWRTRHSVPPKSSPATSTRTSIFVYELSSTERVIYIVTSEPQRYEETGHPSTFTRVPLPLQSGDTVIELPAGDSNLIGRAQVQAINDTRKIRGSTAIQWERVEDRIQEIAQKEVMDYLLKNGSLKPDEYKRLLDVYQVAYMDQLHQEVDSSPNIKHIHDPREVQLRDLAKEDRKTYPTYLSRPLHQRDLAILRTLMMLGLYIGDDDDGLFETIHDFADTYEEYFRNQEEVVEWPPEDFRS